MQKLAYSEDHHDKMNGCQKLNHEFMICCQNITNTLQKYHHERLHLIIGNIFLKKY